ncbi:MAG: hypothetical protein JW732_03360 [Dehalococcoidia bacterium]|nr:hypothetical protein [Dehalococcoidia bacterium]
MARQVKHRLLQGEAMEQRYAQALRPRILDDLGSVPALEGMASSGNNQI